MASGTSRGTGGVSETLFARSVDPIKKIPSVAFDAVTVGTTPVTTEAWLEAAFYPFLQASVTFDAVDPQEKGLVTHNVDLAGKVIAADEAAAGFSNFVLKNEAGATVEDTSGTLPTIGGPDVETVWTATENIVDTETFSINVTAANNGSSEVKRAFREIKFYYPTYYHAGAAGADETAIKGGTKRVETSQVSSYSYTVVTGHFYLAYPQTFDPLTEILNPSNLNVLPSMTRTTPTWEAPDGTQVPYYVYEWTSATTQTGFELRFS